MHSRSEVALNINAILDRVKEAEEFYKNLEPLNFRRSDGSIVPVRKDNTVKSFVEKFFVKFNEEFRTFYKKSMNLYTGIDTRRSVGDVYRAAYSYLGSKITLADIMVETQLLISNNRIASNTCQQINKRVYKERGRTNGTYYNPENYDEFGFTKRHYDLLINHLSK